MSRNPAQFNSIKISWECYVKESELGDKAIDPIMLMMLRTVFMGGYLNGLAADDRTEALLSTEPFGNATRAMVKGDIPIALVEES